MQVIRRRGFFTASSQPPATVELTSVNGISTSGTISVNNAQASVLLVGNGFGSQEGAITYLGNPVVVLAWADTQITVAWPDVPFNPDYNTHDLFVFATLAVTAPSGTANASVQTTPAPNVSYAVITSVDAPSIYANDTGIIIGVDKGYLRVITGTVDTFSAATGLVNGTSPGAQIEYTVFSYGGAQPQWATSVIETFEAA